MQKRNLSKSHKANYIDDIYNNFFQSILQVTSNLKD